MNIYLLLFDAAPFCEPFEKIKNKFHNFGQISNCFTTTSVVSLLTGQMPSDLEKGGIGYETELRYKVNGNIKWPWEDQFIFSILEKAGWEVEIYTDNPFFGDVISQKFSIKYKNIHEKEIIEEIQNNDDSGKNKITFILYNTYHDALGGKISHEKAKENLDSCLSFWNFDQENSFFWLFSDHGDFTKLGPPDGVKISTVGYMTWAMMKDNTDNPILPKTNLISIRDFFPTIMKKLNLHIEDKKTINESKSVTEDLDLERIYYVEDSRGYDDLNGSSVAAAIMIKNWTGINLDFEYSQVNLYKKKPNFITKVGKAYDTNYLELQLKNRFKWLLSV